jgi:hypothetical protein
MRVLLTTTNAIRRVVPRTNRESSLMRNHSVAISSIMVTKAERMPGSVAE